MGLSARVDEDLKVALKGRQAERVSALRMLKADAANAAIAKGKQDLEDPELHEVIRKLIKQHQESAEAFAKGNRPELAEKEKRESAILQAYLPPAMSEAELQAIVQAAVRELSASGPQAMGQVMKLVMPKVSGRADGRAVSEAVKRALAG